MHVCIVHTYMIDLNVNYDESMASINYHDDDNGNDYNMDGGDR